MDDQFNICRVFEISKFDIARLTCITIVDYHCITIVILLSETYACLKEENNIMVGLFCMYRYQFYIETTEKYQNVVTVHLSC